MHPPPPRTCFDPHCPQCYWTLAGELKTIFRQSDDAWERFCRHLRERGIGWSQVKWEDGDVYIHKSFDPNELGEWLPLMYFLKRHDLPQQK